MPEVGPPQSSFIDTHSLDWQSKKEKGNERRHNAKEKKEELGLPTFLEANIKESQTDGEHFCLRLTKEEAKEYTIFMKIKAPNCSE